MRSSNFIKHDVWFTKCLKNDLNMINRQSSTSCWGQGQRMERLQKTVINMIGAHFVCFCLQQ